jgi:hypothetical protein
MIAPINPCVDKKASPYVPPKMLKKQDWKLKPIFDAILNKEKKARK